MQKWERVTPPSNCKTQCRRERREEGEEEEGGETPRWVWRLFGDDGAAFVSCGAGQVPIDQRALANTFSKIYRGDGGERGRMYDPASI
jgi:hypothetical protein